MCVGRSPSAATVEITSKVSNFNFHKRKPMGFDKDVEKVKFYVDKLAVATYYTKVFFDFVGDLHRTFLNSTFCK